MPNKLEIAERRETMKRLVIRGLNNLEIAKALSVSETQIRRDKKYMQKFNFKLIKETPVEDLISEIKDQSKEVVRQAWRIYNATETSDKSKLQSLRIVLEAMDKQLKAMTGIGLIEQGAQFQQTNVQNISITQILNEIAAEEKKEVIDVNGNAKTK